ncbi:MAG: zinc-binding dehydrogenase [Candidatus Thorarchaeota archaeon]
MEKSVPLSEVPEALRYLEDGHVLGKIVVTVDPK